MAMNVGTLVAYLNLDDSQYKRALASAGKGLANLGSLGVKAGAGIAAVGSSVQVIGGLAGILGSAAGALPVLAAGAVAAKFGMVGLSLATDGFSEAINAADPAAFAEAIKEMPPAAQEAAKAVRGMKPAWDEMKKGLQEKLFTGLASEITELGGNYIPILTSSFGQITTAANGAASGILGMLNSGVRIADVRSMTDAFALSWTNVLAAVQPLTGVLLDVGAVASGFLPGLTGGAGDAAQRFADLVSRMRETGELHDMMSRGLSVLGDLGQVAGNVGEILSGVFRAASANGGSLLDTLVATTQSIADMVNSVAGQTALSAFFETAASLSATFMQVLGALLPAVAPLIPLIGQLAQVVGTGLGDVLLAIMPAVAALVEALVGALGPVLPVLATAFGQIADVLGPLAATFVDVLAPILPLVAELFMALVEAIMPLLPPIADLVGALLPVVGAILQNVVIPAIRLVIGVLAEWFKILATGIQLVADFVGGVVSFFTDLGGNVDRIVGDIGRSISDGWNSAVQWTQDAWANLTGAVRAGMDATVNWVRNLPGQILGIITGLGRDLSSSGRAIVDDFLGGIKAGWNVLMGWVEGGLATLRGLWPFSPAKHGPFSGAGYVTHSGKALTGDFAASLRDGMPGVIASARDLMAAAHVELGPASIGSRPVGPGPRSDGGPGGADPGNGGRPAVHIQINNPLGERASDAIGRAGSVLAAVGPWGD